MNVNDFSRAITAEDLIRRYNLDSLRKDRKIISNINSSITKRYYIIENFLTYIEPYKNQAEKITVWFLSGVPSSENELLPIYDTQVANLYFDKDTGFIYSLKESGWEQLDDDNLAAALSLANSEADTSDNKRNVFYSTPSPPYDTGDVWLKNKEILRCRYSKVNEFKESDWIDKENYSDEFARYNNEMDMIKDNVVRLDTSVTEINKRFESSSSTEEIISLKDINNKIVNLKVKDGLIIGIERIEE